MYLISPILVGNVYSAGGTLRLVDNVYPAVDNVCTFKMDKRMADHRAIIAIIHRCDISLSHSDIPGIPLSLRCRSNILQLPYS